MRDMGRWSSSQLLKVTVICHSCSLSLSKQKPEAVTHTCSLDSLLSSVTLYCSKDNKSNSRKLGNKFWVAFHHKAGL